MVLCPVQSKKQPAQKAKDCLTEMPGTLHLPVKITDIMDDLASNAQSTILRRRESHVLQRNC